MLFDFSVVLDYVGDSLFGEANLVEHDVFMLSGSFTCNANSKEVLGVAGVGDVVVLWDVLFELGREGLTSKQEDIVDVDGDDKGVCDPFNLSVEDERVRVGLSTRKTEDLHRGTKVFVPLATGLL